MIDTCKSIVKSKKKITAGLSTIALLVSAGTFATLLSSTNPLWLARSGYVVNGLLYRISDDGHYWSSTVYGSSRAYRLSFDSGSVYPAYYDSRGSGYSVRCIAQ